MSFFGCCLTFRARRTFPLPETQSAWAGESDWRLIQARLHWRVSNSRYQGSIYHGIGSFDWQRHGRVNALLVMQLKSVRPATPALFQKLISLWLLSPRSHGTCLFLSAFNSVPHVYLDVIPLFSYSLSLSRALCSGKIWGYLQLKKCDGTCNLSSWIVFH